MRTLKVNKNELSKKERLDYYCNLNNIVTIATKNSKLGSQICGLSLPAGTTCRPDAPCKKTCYCNKGFQICPTVLGTYMKNFRIYQENPNAFFSQISSYLQYSGYKYMRIFDSGDLPDKEFLGKLISDVILKNPNIKFLMFTKRYEWVNEYMNDNKIPSNFNIVFSSWDKSWKFDNPFNLPVSYVRFKDQTLNTTIPEDSFECTGHCSICYKCWHLKKKESVVFNQH